MLTPEELTRLGDVAEAYAFKRGIREDLQDFRQDVMVAWLSNRRVKIDRLFTDHLRSKFGNLRNLKGAARKEADMIYLDKHSAGNNHEALGRSGHEYIGLLELDPESLLIAAQKERLEELTITQLNEGVERFLFEERLGIQETTRRLGVPEEWVLLKYREIKKRARHPIP